MMEDTLPHVDALDHDVGHLEHVAHPPPPDLVPGPGLGPRGEAALGRQPGRGARGQNLKYDVRGSEYREQGVIISIITTVKSPLASTVLNLGASELT